jgi:hypothetical protein
MENGGGLEGRRCVVREELVTCYGMGRCNELIFADQVVRRGCR